MSPLGLYAMDKGVKKTTKKSTIPEIACRKKRENRIFFEATRGVRGNRGRQEAGGGGIPAARARGVKIGYLFIIVFTVS